MNWIVTETGSGLPVRQTPGQQKEDRGGGGSGAKDRLKIRTSCSRQDSVWGPSPSNGEDPESVRGAEFIRYPASLGEPQEQALI